MSLTERAIYERVVRRLDPQAVVERCWPLLGGVSAQMSAIVFRRGDGNNQTVVVRHPAQWLLDNNPHAARQEFDVLTAVREAGAPAPLAYFYDESGDILPKPYLVLDYIEGEPLFATSDTASYAQQLATQMARLHAMELSRPEFGLLPQQAPQLERRILHNTSLDESIGHGRILEVLQPVWPLPQVNAPVLLHGDLWPGNIIWRDGRLVGIIDWEDALIGDPVSDVAQARLDLLWTFDWSMVNAFTEAYQAMSVLDFSQLPYWDLVAAARPAHYISEWATAWPLVGRPDLSSTTMRRDQKEFADQALAVLASL